MWQRCGKTQITTGFNDRVGTVNALYFHELESGADERARTADLRITNAFTGLFQLFEMPEKLQNRESYPRFITLANFS